MDADIPLRLDYEVLKRRFNTLFPGGGGSGSGDDSTYVEFETVADMLLSSGAWTLASCWSYNPGDGLFSFWLKTEDPLVLPNGIDIQQTIGGTNVLRLFSREADDGTVVPGSGLANYTVSVPVAVPTITDLNNSLFDAPLVFVMSPTFLVYAKGGTLPEDGVDNIINAAGVHYQRLTITATSGGTSGPVDQLYLRYGTKVFMGSIVSVTPDDVPIIRWDYIGTTVDFSIPSSLNLRYGGDVFRGYISDVTPDDVPIIQWVLT